MGNGETRWVKEPELRQYLPISHGRVWQLRREGVLNPVFLGRTVLFDLREVDRVLEALRAEQDGEDTEAVAR